MPRCRARALNGEWPVARRSAAESEADADSHDDGGDRAGHPRDGFPPRPYHFRTCQVSETASPRLGQPGDCFLRVVDVMTTWPTSCPAGSITITGLRPVRHA